jgi:hypothetical protein
MVTSIPGTVAWLALKIYKYFDVHKMILNCPPPLIQGPSTYDASRRRIVGGPFCYRL